MDTYLRTLPYFISKKIRRYRRWQDQQSALLGKMLLLKGLQEYGYTADVLDYLEKEKLDKPFIPQTIEFNISHSGKYILCAFNPNGKVGVDVELVQSIDLHDYQFIFDKETFRSIRQAIDMKGAFFEAWTIREAILKADGCGLTEMAKEIKIINNVAYLQGKEWYIQPLLLERGYLAHVASEYRKESVSLIRVEFTIV